MSTSKLEKQFVEIVKHADEKCKQLGVKLTPKRKQVLLGLVKSEKAVSAYELAEYCTQEFDMAMPTMSVYRILDFLQEAQLVHKLSIANKYVACSHITCAHVHQVPQFLICGDCQKVTEIGIDKKLIQSLQNNVEEAGYQLKSPQLEMSCICKDCIKNAA